MRPGKDIIWMLRLLRPRRAGRIRRTVLGGLLLVPGLLVGAGESQAQEPRAYHVQENAQELLELALREIFFERDSLEALRDHAQPSPGTLLSRSGEEVILSMYVDDWARSSFDRMDPSPDLDTRAHALAAAMSSWGIPTRVEDDPIGAYCEHAPVREPSPEPRGRDWTECEMPEGVGLILRVSYPAPRGRSPATADFVFVPVWAYTAERDAEGRPWNVGSLVRIVADDSAWTVDEVYPWVRFPPILRYHRSW